jgi:hypothetical protein
MTAASPFNNFDGVYARLKELLLTNSVARSPWRSVLGQYLAVLNSLSVEIFDLFESQSVLEYFTATLFANFKAYKLCLTDAVSLSLTVEYNGWSRSPGSDSTPLRDFISSFTFDADDLPFSPPSIR